MKFGKEVYMLLVYSSGLNLAQIGEGERTLNPPPNVQNFVKMTVFLRFSPCRSHVTYQYEIWI